MLFFAIINLTCKLSALESYEVRIVSTFQSGPDAKPLQVRLNYFFDRDDTASIFIKKLNDELGTVTFDTASYRQGLAAIQNRLSLFDRATTYSKDLFSRPAPKSKQKDLIGTYVEQVKKKQKSA